MVPKVERQSGGQYPGVQSVSTNRHGQPRQRFIATIAAPRSKETGKATAPSPGRDRPTVTSQPNRLRPQLRALACRPARSSAHPASPRWPMVSQSLTILGGRTVTTGSRTVCWNRSNTSRSAEDACPTAPYSGESWAPAPRSVPSHWCDAENCRCATSTQKSARNLRPDEDLQAQATISAVNLKLRAEQPPSP